MSVRRTENLDSVSSKMHIEEAQNKTFEIMLVHDLILLVL